MYSDFKPNSISKVQQLTVENFSNSSGIGYETTRHLANHGATVYLACRTEDRARAAIAKLEEGLPENAKDKNRLKFLQVDLGDMHSVKRAADKFMEQETRLDVLSTLLTYIINKLNAKNA